MILGYNKSLPTENDYHSFMKELEAGLKSLGDRRLSLMIYGSFVRGDYNPGRSDIDAVLIFPDDVVINKKNFHDVSLILCRALVKNYVPFQVTVADLKTMEDGRFNSFTPDFEEYFKDEGRIIVGPDYRNQFKFKMPKYPQQITINFNLRKSRQGLLFAEYYMGEDYELFLEKFNKSIDAISRSSKQILSMRDGKLRKNRFSGLEELSHFFPEIDIKALENIRNLYVSPKKLIELYKNKSKVMSLWNSSIDFFEELIKSYIIKFPDSN